MNHQGKIHIDPYWYELPTNRIAKYPLPQRDQSKLLVYDGNSIFQKQFSYLPDILPPDGIICFNNTRVIPARLIFRKESGSRIEIFCLEPLLPSDYTQAFSSTQTCVWKCIVGNLKKWKNETLTLVLQDEKQEKFRFSANLIERGNQAHNVEFSWDKPGLNFAGVIELAGMIPIPPYLNRESEEIDKLRYQTIYNKIQGSVAAPTAGLHFTEKIFEELGRKNISKTEITLHVGAGTFKPVKTGTIDQHEMHTEHFTVTEGSIAQILKHSDNITVVGTTTVRTLESIYWLGVKIKQGLVFPGQSLHLGQWEPYHLVQDISLEDSFCAIRAWMESQKITELNASTQIMIFPGYRFRVTKRLITNFHQPHSTLLLLIAAFIGENWKEVYQYALDNDFRFLSYGDSNLLMPSHENNRD